MTVDKVQVQRTTKKQNAATNKNKRDRNLFIFIHVMSECR